jgi:hypothetical protein
MPKVEIKLYAHDAIPIDTDLALKTLPIEIIMPASVPTTKSLNLNSYSLESTKKIKIIVIARNSRKKLSIV